MDITKFIDARGKVMFLPKKHDAKLAVLTYLNSKFLVDKVYHETDINEVLKKWHSFNDWALLRRELCDYGLMNRNLSGT